MVGALPLVFPASLPSPILGSLGLLGMPMMEGRGLWVAGLGSVLTLSGHPFLLPAVTPSDCYVTLWLPTASSQKLQTRTVKNSRNPIWNQSFRFRIHSQLKVGQMSTLACSLSCALPPFPPSPPFCVPVFLTLLSHPPCYSPLTLLPFQNVLQLQVFDQDLLTSDDPVLSVLFDVGTLQAGEFRRESFSLNHQARLHPGDGRASAPGRGDACRVVEYVWPSFPGFPGISEASFSQ